MNDVQAGWYPDPASRFELRYHNGVAWTADVSTNGDRYVDPLGTAPGAAVHQNTQQPTQQTRQQPGARNGAATASMVLGIVTIVVGWLPFIFAMAAVAGVMAIVLGLRARRRAKAADNGTAITSCERNGNDVTAQGELTNISSNASSFTVRVFFVRPGTDNPRRQANVIISDVEPGEKRSFEVVRSVQLEKVDCIIGSVRGELPFGVDPGD